MLYQICLVVIAQIVDSLRVLKVVHGGFAWLRRDAEVRLPEGTVCGAQVANFAPPRISAVAAWQNSSSLSCEAPVRLPINV